MKQFHRVQHAFTLVELLVVIAILAVLVSLLMPALRKAREQAMAVQCLSNLHQIAVGMSMYANDNRFNIPQDISYDSTGHRGIVWSSFYTGEDTRYPGIGRAYIPTKASAVSTVLRCPKMDPPNLYNVASEYGMYHAKSGSEAFSYASADLSFPNFRGIALLKVRSAARFPLIFDTSGYNDHRYACGSATWMSEAIYNTGTGGYQGVWLAHGLIANCLFADFHAQGCNVGDFRALSVPDRNTSTKTGVKAWKDATGHNLSATW